MPNWCSNQFTVTGSHEALADFVDRAFGLPAVYPPREYDTEKNTPCTTKYLCFNATVPTPQEIIDIGFDGRGVVDITKFYAGDYTGPLDGYHWNLHNWGTKWDIYADNIDPESMGWDEDCEELGMYFLTAWSPPIAWVERLATLFPELNFHLEYEEPGCYFAGEVTVEEGCITYRQYTDEECDALFHRDDDDEDDEDDDDTSPEEPLEKT